MKYFVLLFFFALYCNALAQNYLRGRVKDSTSTGLPYITIGIMNAKDSSLVKGGITDDKGNYEFTTITKGDYILKFFSVGYKTAWSDVITVDSLSQITMPDLILKSEDNTLKEVSVMAFKPIMEFKKGKVIMNIENNILAGGNTVFELLKRLPGVSIDAQNNILVNGQGGVRFMMDGRLQQIPTTQMISILSSMPAESVSLVELISNPSAKYDAAGTGGLINIVMKKAKLNGISGSLFQTQSMGKFFREGTYLNFNYKKNKFTLYTSANYSLFNFGTWNYFQRQIIDSSGIFELISQGEQKPKKNVIFANMGIDYELSKKTVLGVVINGNRAHTDNTEYAQGDLTNGTYMGYNYFKFINKTNQTQFNPTFNINVTHKIDSVTTLQLSGDYTKYAEDFKRFNSSDYYNNLNIQVLPTNRFGTNLKNDFNIYTQKIDFSRDFKHAWGLEAGYKSSFVNNSSNSKIELTDSLGNLYVSSTYSNNYKYKERILAAYISLSKEYKKINFQTGVRSEHTLINANNTPNPFTLHRDYINFFPSGSVGFKINSKNNIQTNYSYRISRPNYDQLNPTRVFNDPFSNSAGNPQLKPQFSHKIDLNYNYNNFINVNLSYLRALDNVYYYAYGDPVSKITIDSVFNFNRLDFTTLGVFIQKKIKWFSFQLYNGGIYRQNYTLVNNTPISLNSYFYQSNINLEFILPKDIKLQVQGYYNSINKDGIQTYYPKGVINFSAFKSFYNRKFEVSISLYDAFYSDIQPWINAVNGQYSYYTERNDTRRVRIFFRWNFGKMRINQNQKRSNEEEKGRLKNLN